MARASRARRVRRAVATKASSTAPARTTAEWRAWVRPASRASCARASAASAGLWNTVPSRSSTWSAPTTSRPGNRAATESALARASRRARSRGDRPAPAASRARSSTSGAAVSTGRAALSSRRRRVGLVEARRSGAEPVQGERSIAPVSRIRRPVQAAGCGCDEPRRRDGPAGGAVAGPIRNLAPRADIGRDRLGEGQRPDRRATPFRAAAGQGVDEIPFRFSPSPQRGEGDARMRSGTAPFVSPSQVFIESKKSLLLLVWRSLSSRNSIASVTPIGLRMRRST